MNSGLPPVGGRIDTTMQPTRGVYPTVRTRIGRSLLQLKVAYSCNKTVLLWHHRAVRTKYIGKKCNDINKLEIGQAYEANTININMH